MTDEATPTGAESAAPAAAPVTEKPPVGPERLKMLVPHLRGEQAEAPEAPEGKPADVEATAPATAEATDAAPAEAEPAEAETPDLTKVAKWLGVSPTELVVNEDGSLGFKTKVDGQEGRANLEALRKSFQLESAHTRRLMELSNKEKTAQADFEVKQKAYAEKEQRVDSYLQLAHDELLGEIGRTDWNALRATDPVEYSARYLNLQQRVEQLNQAINARSAETAKATEAAREADKARLTKEEAELLIHVPSWASEEVRKSEMVDIVKMLKEHYGSDDEEISLVSRTNNRLIRILRDANLYHKGQAAASKAKDAVIKKIEAAPKMAKPGSGSSQDSEAKKVSQLRTAMRKGDKTAGVELLKRTIYANRGNK